MGIVLSRKSGGGSSSGGAPSGPAGGDLTGTYPNPTFSTSTVTAYARTLLDDADAATARATLGMGVAWAGYALLRDQKAANTDGGTFTTGAWRTRTLNTEVFDVGGIVSISSNQFTLQAGTYFLSARAPARGVGRHKCKIVNITDTADTLIGSSQNPGLSVQSDGTVQGRFTIAGAKVFELQHACEATGSTNGFGIASDWSGSPTSVAEVYAEVQIWKEA